MKKVGLGLSVFVSIVVSSSLQANDKVEVKGCLIKKTHELKAEYGAIVTYTNIRNKNMEYNANKNENYIRIDGFRFPYNKSITKAYLKCNK